MFEINDDERNYVSRKVDDKGRLRCPMCRGRGYFEPSEHPNDAENECFSVEELKGECLAFKLPELGNKSCIREPKQRKKITLPSIKANFAAKTSEYISPSRSNASLHKNRPMNEEPEANTKLSQQRQCSKPVTATSNDSDMDRLLIPSPKTPKNPQDFLKSNLTKLQCNDFNVSMKALIGIVQISRYQPNIVEGSMTIIYRAIISFLKSFRSKITRTACQAVNELFSNVPNTQRPEFDELVNALLQKTADTNKFVRRDANEALDSMVINILPIHSVRTLVQKGIPHRNSIIRTTAARLLVCIAGLVGVNTIYMGNKETRNRIVNAAAQCLQDGCQEVRNYGCRLMKILIQHEDFDEVLQGNVSSVLIRRIEKMLITIKYHK